MPTLTHSLFRLASMMTIGDAYALPHGLDRFERLGEFGSNPGNLGTRVYVPDHLPDKAALVVVLHGCTQNAASYDMGSGWSQLAQEHGFALLFPQQRRANNAKRCFNWFSPEDIGRGRGEALSIRQMIGALLDDPRIDPERVFITGLSAGGAMTSVMLATYPELFAGGAILAGMPYGSAIGLSQAWNRMQGQGGPARDRLGSLVRAASHHAGPWPTISVWHGEEDATVDPANADAIVAQWAGVHGIDPADSRCESVDGHSRRIWRGADGRDVIEQYSIAAMGHGAPLATLGRDGCGEVGPHMIETGISSTRRMAEFWGLLPAVESSRLERLERS